MKRDGDRFKEAEQKEIEKIASDLAPQGNTQTTLIFELLSYSSTSAPLHKRERIKKGLKKHPDYASFLLIIYYFANKGKLNQGYDSELYC